jgi:membrane-bound ClpP family serine protease
METYFPTAFCLLVMVFIFMIVFLTASIRIVQEDKRLSVYRLGRYLGDKGPGLVLLIPIVDRGILKKLGEVEQTPSTRLVGVVGETTTTVFQDGKVLLSSGEEWDALSQTPIASGRRVRVVRTILEVEEE